MSPRLILSLRPGVMWAALVGFGCAASSPASPPPQEVLPQVPVDGVAPSENQNPDLRKEDEAINGKTEPQPPLMEKGLLPKETPERSGLVRVSEEERAEKANSEDARQARMTEGWHDVVGHYEHIFGEEPLVMLHNIGHSLDVAKRWISNFSFLNSPFWDLFHDNPAAVPGFGAPRTFTEFIVDLAALDPTFRDLATAWVTFDWGHVHDPQKDKSGRARLLEQHGNLNEHELLTDIAHSFPRALTYDWMPMWPGSVEKIHLAIWDSDRVRSIGLRSWASNSGEMYNFFWFKCSCSGPGRSQNAHWNACEFWYIITSFIRG